ncbi:hypothetical protein AB0B07_00070 [Streptomyces sioyaensis]|uniref:hypothetical protein n=1 Tax=Streptomyces sioyaensis TaxID=67364 RepID=UPI00340FB894
MLAERLRANGRKVEVLGAHAPAAARRSSDPTLLLELTDSDLVRFGVMAEVLVRNGVLALILSGGVHETVRVRHAASGTPLGEIRLDTGQTVEQSVRSAHSQLAVQGLA